MKNLRKDNRITLSETRTKVYLLLSFFLPVLILLVIAWKFKIYPFSSDCLVTEPLQKTYLPVITEFRRKLLNGESLFYSWNVGGGSNFWAWICAYAASPFTLIYLLFSADHIAQATQIVFALKAATAGLCLFLLFWKKENVVSPVSVGVSTAYALCAYVLTYSQEPWILDTVILLPLLILSLHYLIRGKMKWAFSLVCALTGISCCRSGVYMLIFVVIMFPLLYLEVRHDETEVRKLPEIIKDFIIYLLVGIGLSAFVWYPSLQALWKTAPGNEVFKSSKDLKVDLKAWDFLERFALAPSLVFPGDASQLPSVYCGIFPVILTILYAGSRKIRFSEKIYAFSVLSLFYVSMCFSFFQFIVNGLHFPITGKYPQAILITFLIIYMAGRLLSRGIWFEDKRQLWFSAMLLIAFMAIRATISSSYSYASYTVYMAIAMMILYYASAAQIHTAPEKEKTAWMIILSAVMAVEAGLSFYRPIKEMYYHQTYARSASRSVTDGIIVDPIGFGETRKKVYTLDSSVLYQAPDEEKASLLLEKKEASPIGTRIIDGDPDWNNYGLLYDIPSLYSESYLTPVRFSKVLRNLGINRSSDDEIILPGEGTTVTDTFFQMRRADALRFSSEEAEELANVFSNGFFVTTENIREDLFVSASPFEAQNKLAYQLASVKPFGDVKLEVVETENIQLQDDGGFRAVSQDKRAEITLASEEFVTDPNIPIYLYSTCQQKATIEVNLMDVDGNLRFLNSFEYTSGSCLKLDMTNARDRRLQIRISVYNPEKTKFQVYAVTEDREKMKWFQTAVHDSAWTMSEFRAGYAKGTVTAQSSGYVIWSIPADDGWSVTVDGKKAEPVSAYKSFLGVRIGAGTHEIVIKYTPEGFVKGAFASGACVFMMMGLTIGSLAPKKKKKKDDEAQDAAAETENAEKETES